MEFAKCVKIEYLDKISEKGEIHLRKTKEELEQIKKKYGVSQLYSWSKFHTYKTSKFEYFLKYVVNPKVKPDRDNSAYGAYGGAAHQIIEDFYTRKIKYEDMITQFEDSLFTLQLADLKFDRSDTVKNDNIANKYIFDLKHFFRHHNPIKFKTDIERFIIVKIGNNIFQGYIDMVYKDEDGNFIIQDQKTSTIYKGDKIDKDKGQLVLYAEGLHRLGIPLDKIKICWNFLKYTKVTINQANGKTNDREIERAKIGESLKSNAKMWLKKLGYEDKSDDYLDLLLQTNDIECLPKDVQEKYSFDDCCVFIPLNQDVINELKVDILDTLYEINQKEAEYKKTLDENLFWETFEEIDEQSFYFATLCSYSGKLHKPYGAYLDKLKQDKDNKDNIFSNIGVNKDNDENMDWLNEI